MKKFSLFCKEDYNPLPPLLKLKTDKLGQRLKWALEPYGKFDKESVSKNFLLAVREILSLAMEHPQHFSGRMIVAITDITTLVDIELTAECDNIMRCLLGAEKAGDLGLFIKEVMAKIDLVLKQA